MGYDQQIRICQFILEARTFVGLLRDQKKAYQRGALGFGYGTGDMEKIWLLV